MHVHFNLKMSEGLRQRLDAVASDYCLSRAEVMRAALSRYLIDFEAKKSGSVKPQKEGEYSTDETNGKE